MKNLTKRSIAVAVALAILLSLFPAIKVHAATGTFELEEHGQYTYKFTDSYPAPFGKHLEERTWYTYKIKKSDGGRKTAYCIQYGVPASTTTDFNHQTTYGKLNATEKKLLRRALIFGYNDKTGPLYGGSWLDNAMATQAMVWIITSGQYGAAKESKIADICLKPNPKARDIYDKIRKNIEDFDTIPSFASPTASAKSHVMKYNPANGKFELTLTDSNKMLSYFDFQSSDIAVQKSGNKLTLSSAKEVDSVLLSANKKLPKDKLPTLVNGSLEYWTDNTYQDSATLDVSGTPEKIPAYFKLQTEKLGQLKLLKQSEDGVVTNLKFKITGNGINGTYTTDEKGQILIDNLIAGEYNITEVSTPNKYVEPQTQKVTVKPEQTTAVTFDNVLKKFNIYITKSDEETGSTPQGDASLSGAEYDIYNEQGDFVEHIKADETTAKSSLLPLGTYKVYETIPPTGYNLNSEPATVVGDFAGQTVEIGRADTGISDQVIKGQVAVVKFADAPLTGNIDDGGVKQPLENIEFTLTLKSTGKAACTIVTNKDGYAISPLLPYGRYRIEETKGAEGYRKIRPFDIMIDQEGKIYKYILENKVYETDVKILKKDAETGKTIPLAGTQFKIKDSAGSWVTQKYNYPTPTTLDTSWSFQNSSDAAITSYMKSRPHRAIPFQKNPFNLPFQRTTHQPCWKSPAPTHLSRARLPLKNWASVLQVPILE